MRYMKKKGGENKDEETKHSMMRKPMTIKGREHGRKMERRKIKCAGKCG